MKELNITLIIDTTTEEQAEFQLDLRICTGMCLDAKLCISFFLMGFNSQGYLVVFPALKVVEPYGAYLVRTTDKLANDLLPHVVNFV